AGLTPVQDGQQPRPVAVCRDDDPLGLQVGDRNPAQLANFRASLRGERGKPTCPAGRLECPVARMAERRPIPAGERSLREVLPLDRESVAGEGIELGPKLE